MLDLHRLRLLHLFAHHGTIAATANATGYSASAVSQQLAVLERESGAALLERSARSATLTEAGRRLAAHAALVLSAVEAAEADLASLGHDLTGHLTIGVVPTTAALFAPALVALHRAHPGLNLVLRQLAARDAAPALRARELDIAVIDEWPPHPTAPSSVATPSHSVATAHPADASRSAAPPGSRAASHSAMPSDSAAAPRSEATSRSEATPHSATTPPAEVVPHSTVTAHPAATPSPTVTAHPTAAPRPTATSQPDLHTVHLLRDPLLLAVPPAHALAESDAPIALSDQIFAGQPLLCAPPDQPSRAGTDRLLAAVSAHPAVRWEFEGLTTIATLVSRGAGLAVLPRLALLTNQSARLLTPPCHRRIQALIRTASRQAPTVTAVLTALRQAAAAHTTP